MHVHLGVMHLVTAFLGVIVIGFFWRIVAGMNAENALGQAMSFVY